MGWIKIKNGKNRLMLDSSMQYIACISEDRKIKIYEIERLFEVIKSQGKEITYTEFENLGKTLREQNKKWWDSYRKNFIKNKERGSNGN